MFVTSQGHAYGQFRRALRTGNPRLAEDAARELPTLGLADSLELCLLYRGDVELYERAAARWIAKLMAERPGTRLDEVELIAAGMRGLAGPGAVQAAAALEAKLRLSGLAEVAGRLSRSGLA
ncbi:MAG: hypothetical protein QOJ31_105 [Gaiellales bacterium]|jgi:hypothetical protein|nr:hypothetical protein [Gaiellales bacterium]MDX6549421.1 hypothetical protein [Gaiellales bacterium]